jgi:hypothetical protein
MVSTLENRLLLSLEDFEQEVSGDELETEEVHADLQAFMLWLKDAR